MSLHANSENLSPAEQEAIAYLRSPQAIRDRCGQLFDLACRDQLRHFRCDLSQLDQVADYVLRVMQARYPDGQIPFHSRWRHFEVGGISRTTQLNERLAEFSPLERVRSKFDLAIISVLLDAGAGATWRYVEPETGLVFRRSEGLAVASFQMFLQGAFSNHPKQPLRADAVKLQNLTEADLTHGFQVTPENSLVGVQGRTALLQRLGKALQTLPRLFGKEPRPGHLADYLLQQSVKHHVKHQLPASTVLKAVLEGLGEVWISPTDSQSSRGKIASVNLGDVWHHSALPVTGVGSQMVPFHKLSQWLTYSLLEPLQALGLEITGLNELTGLPEYRNGGLCLDLGLLQDKHSGVRNDIHQPGSEVIVEWRSLTVVLLDHIAKTIRQKLGMNSTSLPLVKILEGGTWAAGRQIAAVRSDGISPIQLESDGTVF